MVRQFIRSYLGNWSIVHVHVFTPFCTFFITASTANQIENRNHLVDQGKINRGYIHPALGELKDFSFHLRRN